MASLESVLGGASPVAAALSPSDVVFAAGGALVRWPRVLHALPMPAVAAAGAGAGAGAAAKNVFGFGRRTSAGATSNSTTSTNASTSDKSTNAASSSKGAGGAKAGSSASVSPSKSSSAPASSSALSSSAAAIDTTRPRFFRRAAPISAVAVSADGALIVTGETAAQAHVVVWDAATGALLAELDGHRHGVVAVAFAPQSPELIASVGTVHDGDISLWNWRKGTRIAFNRLSSQVLAMKFNANGSALVTVGQRHVKYWQLPSPEDAAKSTGKLILDGRAAFLGDHRDATFVDVCGEPLTDETRVSGGRMFAVTATGHLCVFSPGRALDQWIALNTPVAFGVTVTTDLVICACQNGVVRIFSTKDLRYITVLPRPLPLPARDTVDAEPAWPDALCTIATAQPTIACVYSDHSLVQWDLTRVLTAVLGSRGPAALPPAMELAKHIRPLSAIRFNSGPLWAIEMLATEDGDLILAAGEDGVVRLWKATAPNLASHAVAVDGVDNGIAVVPDVSVFKSRQSVSGPPIMFGDSEMARTPSPVSPLAAASSSSAAPTAAAVNGIRTLRPSPDGQIIAVGDRRGSLHILNMTTLNVIASVPLEPHELMSVDVVALPTPHTWLVASGGRDRTVHVHEVTVASADAGTATIRLVQTLTDHSGTVTSVRFGNGGATLVTAAMDKNVIVHVSSAAGKSPYAIQSQQLLRGSVHAMELDVSGGCLFLVGQERRVYTLDMTVPKATLKQFDGEPGDSESGYVALAVDPTGSLLAMAGANKSLRVVHAKTGELIGLVPAAHAEALTGLQFTADGQRVVTVAVDGTIAVWRVELPKPAPKKPAPGDIVFGPGTTTVAAAAAAAEVVSQPAALPAAPSGPRLPAWAQALVGRGPVAAPADVATPPRPQGRWAQRAPADGVKIATMHGHGQPLSARAEGRRFTVEPDPRQAYNADAFPRHAVLPPPHSTPAPGAAPTSLATSPRTAAASVPAARSPTTPPRGVVVASTRAATPPRAASAAQPGPAAAARRLDPKKDPAIALEVERTRQRLERMEAKKPGPAATQASRPAATLSRPNSTATPPGRRAASAADDAGGGEVDMDTSASPDHPPAVRMTVAATTTATPPRSPVKQRGAPPPARPAAGAGAGATPAATTADRTRLLTALTAAQQSLAKLWTDAEGASWTPEERPQLVRLRTDLDAVATAHGTSPTTLTTEQRLLERYSEQLVDLVRRKLSATQ